MNTLNKFKINNTLNICLTTYKRLQETAKEYKHIYISKASYDPFLIALYKRPPENYIFKDSVYFKLNESIMHISGDIINEIYENDVVLSTKSYRYGLVDLNSFQGNLQIIDCIINEYPV